eukprot:gnl/MRDRNA2_/MRDRNA2_104771_c0_seq1.p1 gnl/MRDRNA2_/MRDRNA2_104771_c0~~gnl/MRDRNA2_/MRDRNA2_104771_c0_seq1.p1  ORF type:complete len:435 (+),score=75.56 gnl/MRDRNA2_/MRDRNA2_104771_c0_seq1:79-1383(+)
MTIFSWISDMKASRHLKKPKFEDKYLLDEKLGSGSFACVYQCTAKQVKADKRSPQMKPSLAVKVFDKATNCSMFRTEAEIWSSMAPHQNCVTMLEAFEDDRYFYIVMEKCGVSLQQALHWHELNRKDPMDQDMIHTFKGMLSGVSHLHECGIVHRDVKPQNILLAEGHNLFGQPLVKLCDMGFGAKVSGSDSLSEVCGTTPFLAPEMLLLKGYGTRVDVWACGVIAYLMILDVLPYGEGCFDNKEMKRLIRTGRVLPTFKAQNNSQQPSLEAVQFLASLLIRNPEERPSAKEALAIAYLDSSTPPSLKLRQARSKKLQQKRRNKSVTIEALSLEVPPRLHDGEGSRPQRHPDTKAPSHAVADTAMKAPINEVHNVARKMDDEQKFQSSSCSTNYGEDGIDSVVSDESSTYMFGNAEPLANVVPSFKPAPSCISL